MKLKHSFRMQFAFVFVALMASCILISILVSNILLKTYYKGTQMKNLEYIFDDINSGIGRQTIVNNESLRRELYKLSSNNNYTICLFDSFGNHTVFNSEGDESRVVASMVSYAVNNTDVTAEKCTVVSDTGDYKIYENSDSYINSVYYDLVGELDNHIYCMIRVNYAGMVGAARTANSFYAYAGLVIILVEAILIVLILRRFTKPIIEMNDVAKRMAELDFEAKAKVNSSNEIGQLAESLNTLSESLESTILELKNANAELQVDIERKEKIDEMRKEFLGNVSHELKTPIAIIQGYAEGLKESVNDDPESRDFYCDVIADEASKMNNMVKKLLSLNKLEYGNNPLEISRFDITEMVKGVLSASEVLAGDKKVTVEFDDKMPHYVYADEYMTEEVITNFISNAYHYVDGENIIKVSLDETEAGLRFAVYNSGSSIPDEDIEKVWEKFYKVDKARSREYGGSGIGLSIVKAIMDQHGRECGAQNKDDGVEFWAMFDNKA